MYKALPLVAAFFVTAAAAAAPTRSLQDVSPYTSLIERVSPSLVTVHCVLRVEMSMMGQNQADEIKVSVPGFLVTHNLIAVSSEALNPTFPVPDEVEVQITPVSTRVAIPNIDEELELEVVAQDPKIGLTFMKLKGLKNAKTHPLDVANSAKPELGGEVVAVNRLSKDHDYAPYVQRGMIVGTIEKPRRGYIHDCPGQPGLPVFDTTGRLLGIQTTISAQGSQGDSQMGTMGGPPRTFIVSTKALVSSLKQVKASVSKAAASPK